MHVLCLKLNTFSYQDYKLEQMFHVISHIHNVVVKHCKTLLRLLNRNTEYQMYLSEYRQLVSISKNRNLKSYEKKRKTELSNLMKAIRNEIGLSEYALQSWITKCSKSYSKLINSASVQKEVSRVWNGVERVLFRDGCDIHFKRYHEFSTICGKSNKTGIRFDKSDLIVMIGKMKVKCKPLRDLNYMCESLDHKISYCEIKRLMFPTGYHYYLNIYLDGDAPIQSITTCDDVVGIDPGVSTIAAVSDNTVVLEELAVNHKIYSKKIVKLQRKMDISKRMSNPNKYDDKGCIIKKNKDKWQYSNTYMKYQRELKTLYRKKSAYIRQSHNVLCKKILRGGCHILIESMNYKALQKRGKKAIRQDNPSRLLDKNGKAIYKYKRKKRFGKSLNNRAPALFCSLLKQKAEILGGSYTEIDTRNFKASQYNHVLDVYEKTGLNTRFKMIDNVKVQRDLYSAFLISNSDISFQKSDRDICIYEFAAFVRMQNELIEQMKCNHITMKQCFVF